MAKMPMIVTTLTLAAGLAMTPVGPVLATDGAEPVAPGKLTQDILHLEANVFDPEFYYFWINPAEGANSVELRGNIEGTDKALKRVLIVYYNYEEAVTEAEADTRMSTLGVEDHAAWATTLVDYRRAATDVSQSLSVAVPGEAHVRDFAENKSDLVYYVAEFAVPTTNEAGEPVWGEESVFVRGKADYRSCVHAEAFATEGYKACFARKNVETEKYEFLLSSQWGLAELPEVITWAEEWRLLLSPQVAALAGEFEGAAEEFEAGEMTLEEAEEWVAKAELMMKKVEQVGEMEAELSQVRSLAEVAREWVAELTVTEVEPSEPVAPVVPGVEVDSAEPGELEVEVESSGAEAGPNVEEPVEKVENEETAKKEETEVQKESISTLEVRVPETVTGGDAEVTVTENDVVAEATVAENDVAAEAELLVGAKDVADTETVVPSLGEEMPEIDERAGKFNWWWLVIPVVGALGALVWWGKRTLERKID